jgi:hypothetical protein
VRPSALDTVFLVAERAQHGLADPGQAIEEIAEALAGDPDEPRCVVCGCTEQEACFGGCSWATEGVIDLCTACVAPDDCGVTGCGETSAPFGADRYGWIVAAVHGTGEEPAWYCSPPCAFAALREQSDELAAADDPADAATPAGAGGRRAAGARGVYALSSRAPAMVWSRVKAASFLPMSGCRFRRTTSSRTSWMKALSFVECSTISRPIARSKEMSWPSRDLAEVLRAQVLNRSIWARMV